MPNSSESIVKIDLRTDGVRLLPEGPGDCKLTLHFDASGVLDFEDLVDQTLAGIESYMGTLKAVTQADRDGIKAQLVPVVIKSAIHCIPDILDDFENDGEPYWDAAGQLHIPLRMSGSGFKLDLVPRINASGEIDPDGLVLSFEEAYRVVMAEVISKTSSDVGLLTESQKNNIKRDAEYWLGLKARNAVMRLGQSIKFELVEEGDCWLRNGGKITISMVIKVDKFNYIGPSNEMWICSSDGYLLDKKYRC